MYPLVFATSAPGVFRSFVDLRDQSFSRPDQQTNGYPEPFVWTGDPDDPIAAVRRGYQNVRFDPLVGPDDRYGLRLLLQVTPTQRI